MVGRGTRKAPGKRDCRILEATAGRPDPQQITLAHVAPLALDGEEGDAGEGVGEGAGSVRRATLTLLDPRADRRWRWTYYPGEWCYMVAAGNGDTVYLMRDPDEASGSGLYRVAVLTYAGEHVVTALSRSPVSLRQAQRIAREWLKSRADERIAGRDRAWHSRPMSPKQAAFLSRHAPQELAPLAAGRTLTAIEASEAIDRVTVGWNAPKVRRVLWPSARQEGAAI
jgi:hypothetical protein